MFGRAALGALIADGVASLAFVAYAQYDWLGGIWASAAWFAANSFLLWRISAPAEAGRVPARGEILTWTVVKFPLLYLAGFGLMLVPGVKLKGVLVSATAYIACLAVLMVFRFGLAKGAVPAAKTLPTKGK